MRTRTPPHLHRVAKKHPRKKRSQSPRPHPLDKTLLRELKRIFKDKKTTLTGAAKKIKAENPSFSASLIRERLLFLEEVGKIRFVSRAEDRRKEYASRRERLKETIDEVLASGQKFKGLDALNVEVRSRVGVTYETMLSFLYKKMIAEQIPPQRIFTDPRTIKRVREKIKKMKNE